MYETELQCLTNGHMRRMYNDLRMVVWGWVTVTYRWSYEPQLQWPYRWSYEAELQWLTDGSMRLSYSDLTDGPMRLSYSDLPMPPGSSAWSNWRKTLQQPRCLYRRNSVACRTSPPCRSVPVRRRTERLPDVGTGHPGVGSTLGSGARFCTLLPGLHGSRRNRCHLMYRMSRSACTYIVWPTWTSVASWHSVSLNNKASEWEKHQRNSREIKGASIPEEYP